MGTIDINLNNHSTAFAIQDGTIQMVGLNDMDDYNLNLYNDLIN